MKKKQTKVVAKGKKKSKTEQNLATLKRVRGIEREAAIENKTFQINWIVSSKTHVDKKKKSDKNSSREFKRNKGKNFD